MRTTTAPTAGIIVGVVSALAFGASGPFVKTLLEAGWSPGSAVFLRTLGAALTVTGSVLSIAGLVLVIDIAGATPDLLGVVFALGAAVCLGGYFVLSARPTELPPVTLAAGGLLVAALALGGALLVGLLPASAPLVDVDLLGAVVPWWVPMSVIVLVATAFGYVSGIIAASRMGERLASFVGLSEVLFAVLIAWLLLGEVPTPIQAIGGALIVAGVVLVRLDRGRPTEPAAVTSAATPASAA